jgi:hypothetical protein
MPIAKDQEGIIAPLPTGFPAAPVQQVKIVSSNYQDVAVDLKKTPLASLASHLAGSSWTVEYYSQIIDTDTPLTAQSPTLSGVYQGYARIKGLELKVDKPLNKSQQEDTTKMMQLDGGAFLYIQNNQLIPNEGDVFIADAGVEAPLVFRVTQTEKLSIYKEAAYHIDYAAVSTEAEYPDDLDAKTIKELVFMQDQGVYGLGSIIETETADAIGQLQLVYQRLLQQYFPNVFDPEYQTLVIPLQTSGNAPNCAVYDPFLTKFVTEMFTLEDSAYLPRIKVLNVGDDKACRQDNFWTALKQQDASFLKTGFTRSTLVYSGEFTAGGWNNGIRVTGIDVVVYPADPKIGVFGLRDWDIKTPTSELLRSPFNIPSWDPLYDVSLSGAICVPQTPVTLTDSANAVNTMYPPTALGASLGNTDTAAPVAIKPVLIDDYYVLSADFYSQANTMSLLESAVWQYLNGTKLDALQLVKTADLVYNWGVLEQFYYTPILLVLMRACMYGG